MRTGTIGLVMMILLTGAPAFSADEADTAPGTGKTVEGAVGPASVARAAGGAGITQAMDTPREWGQGAAGFGRRFGSGFAGHLVKVGIQYPVARLMHEEFGYRPSGKQGFGPRLAYALEGTVITHKTTTGRPTVSTSELAGAFGSGLISRLWQPASLRTVSAGFLSAGIVLGADASGNVLREFWPEIRHPHRHSEADQPAGKPVSLSPTPLALRPAPLP
jgi:hypothetical protein